MSSPQVLICITYPDHDRHSAYTRFVKTYLTQFKSLGLLFLAELGVSLALLQKRFRNEHILGARYRAESVSTQRSINCEERSFVLHALANKFTKVILVVGLIQVKEAHMPCQYRKTETKRYPSALF